MLATRSVEQRSGVRVDGVQRRCEEGGVVAVVCAPHSERRRLFTRRPSSGLSLCLYHRL